METRKIIYIGGPLDGQIDMLDGELPTLITIEMEHTKDDPALAMVAVYKHSHPPRQQRDALEFHYGGSGTMNIGPE